MNKRGKKKAFTPDQVRRMQEAHAEGTTYKVIARTYNTTAETVRRYCKELRRDKDGVL